MIYDRDIEAVDKHYVNGNLKRETKKNQRFFPTTSSALAEAKEKNEPPAKSPFLYKKLSSARNEIQATEG